MEIKLRFSKPCKHASFSLEYQLATLVYIRTVHAHQPVGQFSNFFFNTAILPDTSLLTLIQSGDAEEFRDILVRT
ncbi:hypothetical protein HB364_25875 [Pseudoflavitalea sp. X16]|uniref:hypothetical protein n=1 Tax=Paraflavitalea devenefica TaxID=2716334 RepID=UPI001420F45B|nr:hypothetical protein [Paraflavitalea devenefica]NII28539.1 hypothetical protein [Paraflavitalea devenefica]